MGVFDEKSDIEFQNEVYKNLIEQLKTENRLLREQNQTKDGIIDSYEKLIKRLQNTTVFKADKIDGKIDMLYSWPAEGYESQAEGLKSHTNFFNAFDMFS